MALESKQCVVVRHSMTIVNDANHALSAGFDLDAYEYENLGQKLLRLLPPPGSDTT